jgi:hypothetical protein
MPAPTPARFENEIDPLGAKNVHKTCGCSQAADFVRACCPSGAFLVLKARVVIGGEG